MDTKEIKIVWVLPIHSLKLDYAYTHVLGNNSTPLHDMLHWTACFLKIKCSVIVEDSFVNANLANLDNAMKQATKASCEKLGEPLNALKSQEILVLSFVQINSSFKKLSSIWHNSGSQYMYVIMFILYVVYF